MDMHRPGFGPECGHHTDKQQDTYLTWMHGHILGADAGNGEILAMTM